MINCVIVDDEPLAREGLASYVSELGYLNIVDQCASAIQALNILENHEVQLLFLDIQMPNLNGLEFLRSLQDPPLTIITTAYPSFALEGYDLDVIDYLVKPITLPRFLKAVQKAKKQLDLQNKQPSSGSPQPEPYLFVKTDQKYEKIFLGDILYIESMQNYVRIVTEEQPYVSLIPLKSVLKELGVGFMKVHKSYVVNLSKVNAVEGNMIIIKSNKIPVSRSFKQDVFEKLLNNKILIR